MENLNMESTKKKSDFDSTNLIGFLYIKRKPILIITILATIISGIASSPLFITPKFKSTLIMFPTTTGSISKALLATTNVQGKYDITEFGEEEQAEQMLQILNSDEIRSKVVQKFDLISHYNIDPNDPFKYTKLFKEYESNISFRRTEFMSVKVDVLDADPQIAANIANDIGALLDTVKNRMQRERAMQGFKIVESEYLKMNQEIQLMEDSLTKIREKGVNDYESQAEVFNAQYAIALQKGDKAGIKALEEKLENISKYGGAYVSLSEILELDREQFRLLKVKYEEAKVDAQENITHKFLLNNAYPAEKKSYPVRWLIVLVSSISALLFSIVLIIGYESFKNIKLEIDLKQ